MSTGRWARAVILGFIGVALVCGFTYYNDWILMQSYLVGNFMPISVYGGLVVFLLLVNTSIFAIGKRLAFSGPELALAIAMTLAACVVPSSGLMRTFPGSILMPFHWQRVETGWKEAQVVQQAPDRMLVDVTAENENEVLFEYLQGNRGEKPIPWAAWTKPLMFWIPLILACWVALLGLALVVHRQWANNEHLPYPVAAFTDALLPGPNSALGAVFRSRLFWIGFALVFGVHMNNYVVQLIGNYWVTIPFEFQIKDMLVALGFKLPPWWFSNVKIYATVVAFAYFLATDVSLSVGLAPILYLIISNALVARGVNMRSGGGVFSASIQGFLIFGAYLGMAMVLMYTGRTFYASVVRQMVFLKSRDKLEASTVWGARIFVISGAAAVAMMTQIGLDWQLSILYFAGFTLTFLVMSRIVAETGLFFVQVYWFPCGIITGLLGAQALGPRTMLIMFMLSMVLLVDPREAFMPFIVNAFKIADKRKVKLLPTAAWSVAAVSVGLAIAIVVTLNLHYRNGVPQRDGWAYKVVPRAPFSEVQGYTQRLKEQGTLEQSKEISGFARLGEARVQKSGFIWALLAGMGLVLICTFGRLRFSGWPLHPVIFLIWASMPAGAFCWSFILGWLVKLLVTKYGGAKVYQQLKPLMFGFIAGEMIALLIPAVAGFAYHILYYLYTGQPAMPVSYKFMPG